MNAINRGQMLVRKLARHRRPLAILAASALVTTACITSADRNATIPSGVINISGGGGGSNNTSTSAGTYKLYTVNDTAPPLLVAYDSATGIGSIGDTTRVFSGYIDSAYLYLNTDLTAAQIVYRHIRDTRTATDSSFDRVVAGADTLFGLYVANTSTVTVTLTDTVGGSHSISTVYSISGTSLTGTQIYTLYNSDNVIGASGQYIAVYDYSGTPLRSIERPSPALASRRRAATIR